MPSPFPGMNPYLENPELYKAMFYRYRTDVENNRYTTLVSSSISENLISTL